LIVANVRELRAISHSDRRAIRWMRELLAMRGSTRKILLRLPIVRSLSRRPDVDRANLISSACGRLPVNAVRDWLALRLSSAGLVHRSPSRSDAWAVLPPGLAQALVQCSSRSRR